MTSMFLLETVRRTSVGIPDFKELKGRATPATHPESVEKVLLKTSDSRLNTRWLGDSGSA